MDIRKKLVAAMGEMGNPSKNATASTSKNSYKYVTLDVVLGTVKPPLKAHGLALLQRVNPDDSDRLWLETGVFDEDEELVRDRVPYQPTGDIQARGSYDTYMRRYRLIMVFGLAGEDDDGQAAMPKNRQGAEHDYSKMGPLVSRYERCYGMETMDAKRSICSRYGNPSEMSGDEYVAFLGALDQELREVEQQQRNTISEEQFRKEMGGVD